MKIKINDQEITGITSLHHHYPREAMCALTLEFGTIITYNKAIDKLKELKVIFREISNSRTIIIINSNLKSINIITK